MTFAPEAGYTLDIVKRQVTPWSSCQFVTGMIPKQPQTLTFTPMDTAYHSCLLGLWEEVGIPGGNPRRHKLGTEPKTFLLERRALCCRHLFQGVTQ